MSIIIECVEKVFGLSKITAARVHILTLIPKHAGVEKIHGCLSFISIYK